MTVLRAFWVPGTDDLLGVCHCGAQRLADDPITLWNWLIAHPHGHGPRWVRASRPDPVADGERA